MALSSNSVLKLLKVGKVFSESVPGNKSDVWKHFSNDYFTALGQYTGFVVC